MAGVSLTADAERAFGEAESLCTGLNIAIVAPEHLLVALLNGLGEAGVAGLPGREALVEAAVSIHGISDEALGTKVMWGSAAREALSATVRAARATREPLIDARQFALGVLDSGELNPGFFAAAGATREALVAVIQAAGR